MLRVRRWVIAFVFVLVTASAIAYSSVQEVKYQAESQVLISRTNLGNVLTGTPDPTAQEFDFNRIIQTQANLARIPRVAARTLKRTDLAQERTVNEFLGQSAVTTDPNTDILTLKVVDPDRSLARLLASNYAREFVLYKQNQTVNRLDALKKDLERQLAVLPEDSPVARQDQIQLARVKNLIALGDTSINVVQTARRAEQTQPKPVRNAILGVFLGALLGVGMAFLVDALDTRMRRATDIETRLGGSLLGSLSAPPRDLSKNDEIAMLADPAGPAAEGIRVLRANLAFADIDHQARSIMITSAVQSEGKSTTIANLAVAMARAGQNIILADFDFRRPYLESFFDLPRAPGFTGLALGHATVEDALVDIDISTSALPGMAGALEQAPDANGSSSAAAQAVAQTGRLRVIPTGELPPNVGEFVTSDALKGTLEALGSRCDVLLIDAPPLLLVGDAMALCSHVHAVLLVARLGVVRRRMVDDVKRLLDSSPARVLGFVVTDAAVEPGGGYGYGSDYYYGETQKAGRRANKILPRSKARTSRS